MTHAEAFDVATTHIVAMVDANAMRATTETRTASVSGQEVGPSRLFIMLVSHSCFANASMYCSVVKQLEILS